MPINLSCPCGKSLRVADEHTGKPVKCPVCGAIQRTTPAPSAPAPPPSPSQTETFDDFEVLEDTAPIPQVAPPLPPEPSSAPVTARTAARPRQKAAVIAEPPPAPVGPPPPVAKPKKKKRKRRADEPQEEDDWYERVRTSEAWMRRMVRGSAFIILGTLIVIGVAIAFLSYSDEIKSTGQRSVVGLIIMGVMGVGAIGKGVFGLVFGQFLGDDD